MNSGRIRTQNRRITGPTHTLGELNKIMLRLSPNREGFCILQKNFLAFLCIKCVKSPTISGLHWEIIIFVCREKQIKDSCPVPSFEIVLCLMYPENHRFVALRACYSKETSVYTFIFTTKPLYKIMLSQFF